MDKVDNNKRIAANTTYLYLRSILTIIISLYSSRVILDSLGVVDFGLYNVIGGVVLMFSFLNNALTSAVQRFISFELGRKNYDRLNKIFCSAVNVHILLALMILVLTETIGLWFFYNYLNIPPEREFASFCVYQATIFSLVFTILQVPSLSCIIAHEKLNVYAVVCVVDVILKLVAAVLLYFVGSDRLIMYAIMLFLITAGTALFYTIYSHKKFQECSYHFIFDKVLNKELLSFSTWSLYGGVASITSTQGVNIILNIFFDATVNAARGVAYQVNAAVSSLYSSFSQAINPQIVKQYSSGNVEYVSKLVLSSSRFIFFLVFIFALPILVETSIIFKIWLGNIPDHTVVFCQLILIATLFDSMSMPFVQAIQATGKVKTYQLLIGSTFLLDLPLSYLVIHFFSVPEYCFLVHILVIILVMSIRVQMYGKLLNIGTILFWKNLFTKIIPVILISSISFVPHFLMRESYLRLLVSLMFCAFTSVMSIYWIGINVSERSFVKSKLLNKLYIRNMHLSRVLSAIKHRIFFVLLHIKYFIVEVFYKNTIYVQYSVYSKTLNLQNRNFGDDINLFIVEYLSGKKVIPYRFSILAKLFNRPKFMCIGSVITMFDLNNTTIWGSGVLSSKFMLKNQPVKVCAVRGPLSQKYLIEKGIDCPDVYGDPALLLPTIYNPSVSKKYKIGIVAHYLDHRNKALSLILSQYPDEILFINVANYGSWKKYIKDILSCEMVISSSLHGLIVADAYKVPNIWSEFDFKMDDNGFKFQDYFLSVGKQIKGPIVIDESYSLERLLELKLAYQQPNIELANLINNCPFRK